MSRNIRILLGKNAVKSLVLVSADSLVGSLSLLSNEYYGAAEPPVRTFGAAPLENLIGEFVLPFLNAIVFTKIERRNVHEPTRI